MKKFLKKISFYTAIVLLYFLATAMYNYSYDPYGILGNRKEFIGVRPNEHSLKVQHVLQNPNKYNSLLFSNSKGGTLHFSKLNNTQDEWYNMTYSLGTPEEFYDDIQRFINNKMTIKNIVVALDDGAIFERTSSHENQASRKFVALDTKTIHWDYLFLPISFKKIKGVNLEKKHIQHDIFLDGNYYEKNAYDLQCKLNEKIKLIPLPKDQPRGGADFNAKLKELLEIQKLCVERNINLVFLIHPTSYDNYMRSKERLIHFYKLISALEKENVTILRPFEKNIIENNPCFWLDRHHYSSVVGDSIVKLYDNFIVGDSP